MIDGWVVQRVRAFRREWIQRQEGDLSLTWTDDPGRAYRFAARETAEHCKRLIVPLALRKAAMVRPAASLGFAPHQREAS